MLRVVHERDEREPVDRPQSGPDEMVPPRRPGDARPTPLRLVAVASALRLEIGVLLGVLPEQESN